MTDDEAEYIALRAERLRCLVAAIGEEPTMEPLDNVFEPGGYRELIGLADYEGVEADLHLAWECVDLARELREEAWRWFQWATYCLSLPPVDETKNSVSRDGANRAAGQAVPMTTLTFQEALRGPYWALGWLAPAEPVVPVSEECARYAELVEADD